MRRIMPSLRCEVAMQNRMGPHVVTQRSAERKQVDKLFPDKPPTAICTLKGIALLRQIMTPRGNAAHAVQTCSNFCGAIRRNPVNLKRQCTASNLLTIPVFKDKGPQNQRSSSPVGVSPGSTALLCELTHTDTGKPSNAKNDDASPTTMTLAKSDSELILFDHCYYVAD